MGLEQIKLEPIAGGFSIGDKVVSLIAATYPSGGSVKVGDVGTVLGKKASGVDGVRCSFPNQPNVEMGLEQIKLEPIVGGFSIGDKVVSLTSLLSNQLAGMGFTNLSRNQALLPTYNGNLSAVVGELVKMTATDTTTASGPAAPPAPSRADLLTRVTLGLDTRGQWQSTDQKGLDDVKLFAVRSGSSEHVEIASEFDKTLPHLQIDTIERIENGYQHEQFSVHAKAVKASCGATHNRLMMRRLLFHGTDAVDSIVNDMVSGFKPLLSGTVTGAIHGDGTCESLMSHWSSILHLSTMLVDQPILLFCSVATVC